MRNHHNMICPILTGGAIVAAGLFASAAGAQNVIEVRKVYIERPPRTVAIIETVKIPTDSIHLYRDANFTGEVVLGNITASQAAGQAHDLPADMADSVSSLRWSLPPGVLVVLYEDDGAKGEQIALWGSGQIDALSTFDFNDKASEWAWFYVGSGYEPSEVVVRGAAIPVGALTLSSTTPVPDSTLQLFKSKNFEANTVALNPLSMPANTLHPLPEDLPDSLTSMRWNLPPGVVIVFYQDADGAKQQVPIWGSGQVADLDIWDFNDKASRWAWYYVGSPEVEVIGVETVVVPVREKETTVVPATPIVVVERDAIDLVGRAMVETELDLDANDLRAKKNPVGEGTFVYVPQTTFNGVERHVVWLVIGDRAYALSGAAKLATPTISVAADADKAIWARSGINQSAAEQDAVKVVFADH